MASESEHSLPARMQERDSEESIMTAGASRSSQDRSNNRDDSTPSDDSSTAYFHSAGGSSTEAGSGAGSGSGNGAASGRSDGNHTTAANANALSQGMQNMNISTSFEPQSLPAHAGEATASFVDEQGITRQDYAQDPVLGEPTAIDSLSDNKDHSNSHNNLSGTAQSAHQSEKSESVTPVDSQVSSHIKQQDKADPAASSSSSGFTSYFRSTGGARRPSNPFMIDNSDSESRSSAVISAADAPASASPGNASASASSSRHLPQEQSAPAAPPRRRQPQESPSAQRHLQYTSSGPSRARNNISQEQQRKAVADGAAESTGQSSSHQRQQSRAQRAIPLPNIDAAKQDYFSRHPDPDHLLRRSNASSSRPVSKRSHSTTGSQKASDADRTSIPSEDEIDPSQAGPFETLLSPALSTATLSSGVSVGPSMGGYERIFPIRSVVTGQKAPPPTPLSTSYNSGRKASSSSGGISNTRGGPGSAAPSARQSSISTASVMSAASTSTAHQRQSKRPSFEDTLHEELEVGTDYSRRSPIPDDVSDFSYKSTSSRAKNHGSSVKRDNGEPPGEGEMQEPLPQASTSAHPLNRGDPASLYGDAQYTSVEEEGQQLQDERGAGSPISKPPYSRNDSLLSHLTGSSMDPAAISSASAKASSYPTTSRMSDDSDPTARKEHSTNPSTVSATPGTGSSYISRRPGLTRIDSQDLGDEDNDQTTKLKDRGVHFNSNDPTQRAREAFEKGETEEGPSVESGGLGSLGIEQDGLFVTARFEHQETEDGHMIVTGRKGELLKCEDEPIHIPGAIQDYGVLIAIEEDAEGHFVVTHVSENSGARLGLPPKLLFSLNCFTEILDEDQGDAFLEAMEALDENNESEPSEASVDMAAHDALASMNTFQLIGQGAPGSGMDGGDSRLEWTCWCAVHRPDRKNKPKLAIIELEHENDLMNPVTTERSQEEIDEDMAADQPKSLFGEDEKVEKQRREDQLRDHQNTGLDPADLPRTDEKTQTVTASSKEGPPDSFPGVGRADGEVLDPTAAGASRHGTIGSGGGGTATSASGSGTASSSAATSVDTSAKSFKPPLASPEGLGQAASKEEIDASTISRIKPIRAMRRLRKSKGGGDILKLFSLLGQINTELTKTQDLQASLEIAVGVVAEVTGFHRVMIYQFDDSWNGQVVAELVDYKQTRDLYRGLHFPASDIPTQARELYKINKVRLLYDRDQPTARLVCRNRKELETPLNLTHSQLRAMSPIHVKYLVNMGVRASMSISIIAFGQLWGLISCHTYGRYGQRVSFPGRQLCRIIGDSISRNIERLSYAQRLQSRKLINTIPTNSNPGGYIIAKAEDLLSLFDADFGVLSIGDEAKILGSLDNSQEVLAILEYLRVKRFEEVQSSVNILADFPDLDYPAGFQQVAGMLMVPLSRMGQDFIAFFRRGQLENVHWAGNPYEKVMRANQGKKRSLEPRKSFKIWSETVVGKSRGWSDENMETASVLRLVYGKFIEVWRQREAAVTSSRLTSLLLSNASHEVRTPLNHIINYLEMALEGPLDDDTRESLVRSHSASRALVHVINDLLDLTRTESNQNMFLQDPLDLSNTIDEAVAIHRLEAQRRGVAFEVIENPSGTPQTLLGDRGKIRQIVANVTANAVKHTKQGRVTVEWGEMSKDSADPAEASQDTIKIGISVTDTGAGIPEDQLEEMFRTFEQVETDDGDSQQLKSPAGNLGLGLAVVARIVSQLGGQLRVESKVGHGSKFTFVLHFRLPGPQASSTATHSVGTASDGRDSVGRILTDSSAAKSLQKANSANSLSGSYISKQMSNDSKPSDIESLVEVISGNHMSVPPSTHRHTEHGEVELRPRVAKPGQVEIEDSGTPLRSVKIDEGDVEVPAIRAPGSPASRPNMQRKKTGTDRPANPAYAATGSVSRPGPAKRASTNLSIPRAPDSATQSATTSATPSSAPPPSTQPLRIMIVEDDAINRAILLKKLTRDFHHKVSSTVHGEEAVRLFEKDRNFDMILMDLQMPICDGFTATKRIRQLETDGPNPSKPHSPSTSPQLPSQSDSAVPIFAVSASLLENQYDQLITCGFSGFILKPINFARLQDLMRGTYDPAALDANQYIPGRWEKGGWLQGSSLPSNESTA